MNIKRRLTPAASLLCLTVSACTAAPTSPAHRENEAEKTTAAFDETAAAGDSLAAKPGHMIGSGH